MKAVLLFILFKSNFNPFLNYISLSVKKKEEGLRWTL